MSAHMKKRPINGGKTIRIALNNEKDSDSSSWRDVFAFEINNNTESGIVLKGARNREGLTQKQLAEKLNELGLSVSQHHISEMERGLRSIGKKIAHALGKALSTSYKNFL